MIAGWWDSTRQMQRQHAHVAQTVRLGGWRSGRCRLRAQQRQVVTRRQARQTLRTGRELLQQDDEQTGLTRYRESCSCLPCESLALPAWWLWRLLTALPA